MVDVSHRLRIDADVQNPMLSVQTDAHAHGASRTEAGPARGGRELRHVERLHAAEVRGGGQFDWWTGV